jgi:hypothetical protein
MTTPAVAAVGALSAFVRMPAPTCLHLAHVCPRFPVGCANHAEPVRAVLTHYLVYSGHEDHDGIRPSFRLHGDEYRRQVRAADRDEQAHLARFSVRGP